jgi:F0F1-type ATP synthase membrane subunit b/b'
MPVFKRDRRPESEPSDNSRSKRVRAAAGQRGSTEITEVIPEVVERPAQEESTDVERSQGEITPALPVTAENIGEHVSSVLQSAQHAARTIQDDARREAASLVERARREADETRARASTEADAKRSDAERALQTAREQADQTREDADAHAQQRRQEAEQEAVATLQAAKERDEELLSNVAMTEDRLSVLSTALKTVALELDELLVEDEPPAAGSEAAREELDTALRSRTRSDDLSERSAE